MGIAVTFWEVHWLQFTAQIPRGRIHGAAVQRCVWDLLKVNGSLAGAAKLNLAPGSDMVTVTRECWLDPESFDTAEGEAREPAIASLVRVAIDDLAEAMAALHGKEYPGQPDARSARATGEVDLAELCQLAGWPCNQRAENTIAVPLDVPGSYVQAILSQGSRVRATIEFPLEHQSLSSQSRQAIGLVLLQLSGHVRCVRAAVHAETERESAMLEAQLEPLPYAVGLNQLLAALSVAAQKVIRDLPALACAGTAETYLSIRGWSP
jgi:hypothetical protein